MGEWGASTYGEGEEAKAQDNARVAHERKDPHGSLKYEGIGLTPLNVEMTESWPLRSRGGCDRLGRKRFPTKFRTPPLLAAKHERNASYPPTNAPPASP